MYHHDARDYNVAVDETARKFQAELDALIEKGRASAIGVIEKVQNEVPVDRLMKSTAFEVAIRQDKLIAGFDGGLPIHRHALGQIAERAAVPDLYVTRLLEQGSWGRELLAHNFNQAFQHIPEKRLLVREVNGEVRGVLSDSFRRMDSRPLIETFAQCCLDIGAVPVEGVGGDLRFEIKALLPMIFRPGKDGTEVIALGAAMSNSDFGVGAYSIRVFCLRIWCSNYAKLDETLRQVHLGKRLGDTIQFSERTYQLDTETMVSATKDIIGMVLGPVNVNKTVQLIGQAMDTEVDVKGFMTRLPKLGLLKGEVEAVEDTLLTGDVRQLPAGNTLYRMSNAISWIAKSAETAERRLELEQIAGQLLMPKAA